MAEATGRVEILPLHVGTAIEEVRGEGLYAVSADHIDETGQVVAHRRFTCEHLFLAAGSVGTTKLLVRARATGMLPRLNDHVGRHWAGNGDFVVTRVGLPPTNPGTGGPAGHFIMEDTGNPFGPIGLVELVTPRHLALLPGLSAYVGMAFVPAVGEFGYDAARDRVSLTWPDSSDPRLASFLAGSRRTLDTLNSLNSDAEFQPATLLFNPTLTAHPLGGATLGTVCDLDGRVVGHPGLYVVDGALIPGSAGLVNPSLTIAALAERCMERILDRDVLR